MKIDLANSYRDKKVLVTGHSGFKGSWLVELLYFLGARVYGISIDRPTDPKHIYYALNIESKIENSNSSYMDVTDSEKLNEELIKIKPDFIFHLAAQSLVSKSVINPFDTFKTNIFGTQNILESVKCNRVNATIVLVTSDKCYKNSGKEIRFVESDELGGSDPYSASKAASEIVIQSYFRTYPESFSKFGAASVRAGNVFGGGDWSPNRLVPDCVTAAISGKSLEIRMPNATRPWTLVHDILRGYLMIGTAARNQPQMSNEPWNFASDERYTVGDVASIINSKFNVSKNVRYIANETFEEVAELQLNPNKSNKLLGWSPVYNLKRSLELSADWYLNQNEGKDMAELSRAFIDQYLNDSNEK
jgi:CDP-glucose 4,6-dehydratase